MKCYLREISNQVAVAAEIAGRRDNLEQKLWEGGRLFAMRCLAKEAHETLSDPKEGMVLAVLAAQGYLLGVSPEADDMLSRCEDDEASKRGMLHSIKHIADLALEDVKGLQRKMGM